MSCSIISVAQRSQISFHIDIYPRWSRVAKGNQVLFPRPRSPMWDVHQRTGALHRLVALDPRARFVFWLEAATEDAGSHGHGGHSQSSESVQLIVEVDCQHNQCSDMCVHGANLNHNSDYNPFCRQAVAFQSACSEIRFAGQAQ